MKRTTTILDVLTREQLLGPLFAGDSWRPWHTVLRALFALPPEDGDLERFTEHTGRTAWPTAPGKELWAICGRRSGKSRIAAALAVFCAAFRRYRLAAGETGRVLVIANDKSQASVTLDYVRAMFDAVPMLRALVTRQTEEVLHLRNRLRIEVRAANFRSLRGSTIVACILDEVAFFKSEESAQPDIEIYRAVRPAMATVKDALLIGISSPFAASGLLYEKFRQGWSADESTSLAWKAATLEMNAALDPSVVEDAYRDDPEAASAEYGGEFRKDVSPYLSREALDAVVVEGRTSLPCQSGVKYLAAVDMSGGASDSAAVCIAHHEDGHAIVDLLVERRAPHSPEVVTKEFADVLRGYGVRSVVGDKYAAAWVRERFQGEGILYEPSSPSKSDFYAATVPIVMSRRVQLLDDKVVIAQFLNLVRKVGRGTTREIIDHRAGWRDDLANATAIAIVLAAEGRSGAMPTVFLRQPLVAFGGQCFDDHVPGVTRAASSLVPSGLDEDMAAQMRADGWSEANIAAFDADLRRAGK